MFGLLKSKKINDYRKFRWFFTSNGILVVGGKSDDQNELVIRNFLKPSYTVVHTTSPGSPFMIIQSDNPSRKDLEEAAVFCACFSKQWKNLKNGKEKIEIDIFQGDQIYKTKMMKKGTFGVKNIKEKLKVIPEINVIFQKGKLRTVPISKDNIKNNEILAEIKPGKLTKEEASNKIFKKIKDKYHFPISKEEILQAIPSNNMNVR